MYLPTSCVGRVGYSRTPPSAGLRGDQPRRRGGGGDSRYWRNLRRASPHCYFRNAPYYLVAQGARQPGRGHRAGESVTVHSKEGSNSISVSRICMLCASGRGCQLASRRMYRTVLSSHSLPGPARVRRSGAAGRQEGDRRSGGRNPRSRGVTPAPPPPWRSAGKPSPQGGGSSDSTGVSDTFDPPPIWYALRCGSTTASPVSSQYAGPRPRRAGLLRPVRAAHFPVANSAVDDACRRSGRDVARFYRGVPALTRAGACRNAFRSGMIIGQRDSRRR
jgi:hypothetical protein